MQRLTPQREGGGLGQEHGVQTLRSMAEIEITFVMSAFMWILMKLPTVPGASSNASIRKEKMGWK